MFVTLEGVDGAGKSTHIPFVADCLRKRDAREVLITREPGGTPLAESLRELVLREAMGSIEETFLMLAARSDHVRRVIRPALEAGRHVLCDRFTDATFAYQGAGKGVDLELIRGLTSAVTAGLTPDLTILFDCTYEVARERLERSGRALDRFERENRAFHDRVRGMYLELARNEPRRFLLIDASMAAHEVSKALEVSLVTL